LSLVIETARPPSVRNVKIDPKKIKSYTPLRYPPNKVVRLPFTVFARGQTSINARIVAFLDGAPLEGCALEYAGKRVLTDRTGSSQTLVIGKFGDVKVSIDLPDVTNLLNKKPVEVSRHESIGVKLVNLNLTECVGISPEIVMDLKITSEGILSIILELIRLAAKDIWPTYHHDNKRTGKTSAESGIIYIGSTSDVTPRLYAVDYLGSIKWAYELRQATRSHPAVDEDTIYIGDGVPGAVGSHLYAVDGNGALKWEFQSIDVQPFLTGPAIDRNLNTIYAADYWGNVYAFNKDGTLKWYIQTGLWNVWSNLLVDEDGVVYIGFDGDQVTAINPDGSLKWVSYVPALSGPAVDGDTIYLAARDYYFYAVSKADGSVKWSIEFSLYPGYRDPSIDEDGTIYIGSEDQYLYALNPDGSLKWKYLTGGWVFTTPAIGMDEIYFGSDDYYLYSLTKDGTLKWRYGTYDIIDASPVLDANGVVYFSSWDGSLYAVNVNGVLEWKVTGPYGYSCPGYARW